MKANINANSNKDNGQPKSVKVTAESLKDGTVLNALILRFLNNRNQENMFSVLTCLRDSCVWVPALVNMNGEDMQKLMKKDNPIAIPVKHSMMVKPQIITTKDGELFVPVYSRRENIKSENIKGFSIINIPYVKLLEMIDGMKDCNMIVIDPYLNNLVLDENLISVSKKLPSRLSKSESGGK